MVEALEGVVREAHQFMHGIVEETADAGRSFVIRPTARVFASVFSMGVPVKPMNDAFGKAPRRLLAKL